MKENRNLSSPKKGMNRDSAPFNLKDYEYPFAFNTMFESESGDSYNPKNELSNELAAEIPAGFKVVGFKKDVKEDRTIFWITNPETEACEIGFIKNGDSYVKLVDSPDLNFSIYKPIKKLVIKYEKLDTVVYWVDDHNPDRFLNLGNIEDFYKDGNLDVDKLRIDSIYSHPTITPVSIEAGGQLEKGMYEVSITYCDKLGNEIAEYISTTNPIHIFDNNDRVIDNTELNEKSNQAIKLRVENLDNNYRYYKVIVVQKLLDSTSYFIEGIHPINDTEIVIPTLQGKQRTDINKLLATKTTWVKSRGITSSNGYLFRFGLTAEEEINLQPISNLMGAFLKWQTVEAKEDLYERGESASLYKGYYRDEVYPLSWRFKSKTGYISANFPLVSRPATTYFDEESNIKIDELAEVDNLDTKSVNALSPGCSEEDRNKYWQFYNTAHGTERYTEHTGETTNITQLVHKYCVLPDFNKIENKKVYLDISETGKFEDLRSYIEDYGNNLSSMVPEDLKDQFDNQEVQEILTETLPGEDCKPYFKENCENPTLLEDQTIVYIGDILGEKVTLTPKEAEEYRKSKLQSTSGIHEVTTDGRGKVDEEYIERFDIPSSLDPKPFVRRTSVEAERCSQAKEVQISNESNDTVLGIVPQYYGEENLEDIQQNVVAEPNESEAFTDKIHKGAIWFKSKIKDGDKAFIEIPKWVRADFDDTFYTLKNHSMRVSVYTGRCANLQLLKTFIVDIRDRVLLHEDPILKSELQDDEFYIALDFPVYPSYIIPSWFVSGVKGHYITAVPNGTIGLQLRSEEFVSAEVTFDRLTTHKQQKYELQCTYEVPVFNECEPQPHTNGKFAYWESTEKYPDNKELYDSSNLEISIEDIPEGIKRDFEEYFVASKVNNKYVLKQDTDFTNKPIRHFKFPDFKTAPFMSTNLLTPFSESLVYPLGVTIDKEVINAFLDLAVKNKLLTQYQRDSIESVEFFRGDRRVNKSILGKGIAFDLYNYEEENTGNKVLFSNFPYNDLGDNELIYSSEKKESFVKHPYKGERNSMFTLHSPEYDYYNQTMGTEISLESYQYGASRGNFMDVQKHPEWVILGKRAYTVATTLAVLEYTLEAAIRFTTNIIQSSQNYWFFAGISGVGANIAGSAVSTSAAIALTAFDLLTNSVPIVGRYRYEWLKIFRDFGKPENFAFQYSSEGFYNYAEPNHWFTGSKGSEGNALRGISTGKELKEGQFIFTERDGQQLRINNLDRERGLLLTFGDEYPIDYPISYKTFDNSNLDKYASSRMIASETGDCSKGKGEEIQRKVASPYMAVKNYVPFQYGSINSVKWLPTGTTVKIDDEEPVQIFGGDIYISRYTLKRKTPLFNDNAFGLADMLPYEYSKNNNVGFPRFFCDYELGSEGNLGDMLFPDFESDYSFDCQVSNSKTYVKSPSKFYLFYYGIPNFLVESEINLNLRYGKKEPRSSFYPEVGDFNEWTQEKNVSIREPNRLFYNNVYSSSTTPGAYRTLPDYYSKEEFKVIYDSPSGVIYSLQDNSENDLNDPWLIYRPLDKYQFPTSYGKLIDLEGVDSGRLFGRFENTSLIFNEVNDYREAQTAATREMGTGGVFDARPVEFSSTELGYRGSNTYQMVSNEYGHFYPDAERGQVFLYPGGKNAPIEISSNNGKESTGMKAWFKEHLPFKIKDSLVKNYEDIDTDNALNGIGITMGWDSKYDRVFLTKLDYSPVKEMEYHGGKFMTFDCNPIQFCKYDNKEQTIQEKLDEGYKFVEEGCKIVFEKYTEVCKYETYSYTFPQDQIDALIQDGYTLLAQDGSTMTFEKTVEDCDNDSKDQEIQELLDQGYSEYFPEQCDFTSVQGEIDGLINDGYVERSQTDCTKTFDKTSKKGYDYYITSLTATPDGKILVYGYFQYYDGLPYEGLVKIDTDGVIDTSFNIGSGVGGNYAFGKTGTTFDQDGKIYLGTYMSSYDGNPSKNFVRINSDGSFDNTFNIGSGFSSWTVKPFVDNQNRVLVPGIYNTYKGVTKNRLVRILPNGDIDNTFQYNGGANNTTTGFLQDPATNKYYVTGYYTSIQGQARPHLTRLNEDGTVDLSFDPPLPAPANPNNPIFMVLDQGKLVIGGYFDTLDGNTNQFARLNEDGSIDNTFNAEQPYTGRIESIAQDGDKYVVYGIDSGDSEFSIRRYNRDGSLDNSFNYTAPEGYAALGSELLVLNGKYYIPMYDSNAYYLGEVDATGNATIKDFLKTETVDGIKNYGDCDRLFKKDVCSFDNQQADIDDLIAQGYELVGETECSKVFEKADPVVDNEAKDDFVQVSQGGTSTFNVVANDITGSSQDLAILDFTMPSEGTLVKVNSGTFRYTHNGGSKSTDSFTYRAENDMGITNYATVSISISIPYLDVDPVETTKPTYSTGTSTFTVESRDPWTATLTEDIISGDISVDKLSGTAGITVVTVSYTNAKGAVAVTIESAGLTKTHTIRID